MNILKAQFGLRLSGFTKGLLVVNPAPVAALRPQTLPSISSSRHNVTMAHLIQLSLRPVVGMVKRYQLQAELRRLRKHASYFQWQQENGAAGLADTQKRIALAQSDLNALSREYFH
jgi:hypothetical protein